MICYYLHRRRLCFHFGLFVCLSVCLSNNGKSCEQILTKFLGGLGHHMAQGPIISILVTIRITVRVQESEVRNLHSLDCRKSYQRILIKFYGELGCGLETNSLHPDHRPDSRSRSPKSGFTGLSIMLVFGRGLRSLSTFSYSLFYPT